jgi:hypothetical protein
MKLTAFKKIFLGLCLGICLFFISSIIANKVHAASVTVNDNREITYPGSCTFRDAIKSANTNVLAGGCVKQNIGSADIDTVYVQPNTYILDYSPEIGINRTAGQTYPINIIGLGGSRGSTVIDGNYIHRILHIDNRMVNISNLTLQHGLANTQPSGGGALVADYGGINLDNVEIKENSAPEGGALMVKNGTLNINNSYLHHNHSQYSAGISLLADYPSTITNTTIANNIATDVGGGLVIYGAPNLSVINTTISGNQALEGTGITIYPGVNSGDIMNFINVTIADNFGAPGNQSGAKSIWVKSNNTFRFQNSIITGSNLSCRIDSPQYNPQLISLGGNITSDWTCPFLNAPTDKTSNPNINLQPLDFYGGLVLTRALNAKSAARNIRPVTNSGDCPLFDARGVSRNDGFCDAGAYEYGSTLCEPFNLKCFILPKI